MTYVAIPGRSKAEQLERIAGRIHSLAFDFAEPATSLAITERRIADVERAAADLRAVVRGRPKPS